jgi:hypothetical protein
LIANPCAPIEGSELRAAPRAQLSQPQVVAGCTRPWLSQYPGIYFDYDSPRADHPDLQVHPRIGRQARFSEPFASAVHGVCSKKELADRGLDLIRPDSSSEDRRDDA